MDDDELAGALAVANLPTLLMVLVHLTGDGGWLRAPFRPTAGRGVDDHDDGGLPEDIQAHIRSAAFEALRARDADPLPPPTHLAPSDLAEMMSACMGEPVGSEYGPLIAAELGLDVPYSPLTAAQREDFRVLVVGAGVSGLCAAVELQRAGIPYTVIEQHETVGGTWLENQYPGCGCDTPSHLYSLSSMPQPERWSRYYATRDQIHSYLEQCARAHGVTDRIQFETHVVAARWDAPNQQWLVTLRDGQGRLSQATTNAIISSVGQFNPPKMPPLEGLESFVGPAVHTARWPRDLDISGRRVAVVGTGASAMQVVPAIAPAARRVTVFQRSRQWVMPNPNYHRSVTPETRFLFEHVPYYASWYRLRLLWLFGDRMHQALQVDPVWEGNDRSVNVINDSVRRFLTRHMERELGDRRDLLEQVVPSYPPFGKRMLMDNGWLQTLRRPDVELVEDPIARVRPRDIVTRDGRAHPADFLVFATGFDTLRFLWSIDVTGRSGKTLQDTWGDRDARAYLGITMPDFPNLFLLYGPNTNPHGGSVIFTSECQIHYVVRLLSEMLQRGVGTIECRQDVHDTYNRQVDAALAKMVSSHPSVTNYFRNEQRVVTNTPWRVVDYWHRTREPDFGDYLVEPTRQPPT